MLELCEMWTASVKIWTGAAKSTSNDENRYATNAYKVSVYICQKRNKK